MGYTPAFDSIYTGTLYGRWPTAAVWASLLPLVDKHGQINLSFEAISGMTGWPMDLLRAGVEALTQPDPDSRSPAEEGRRLILIDSRRPWGWQVVNHGLYREKARKMAYDAERTASGKDAERKKAERSRDVPRCPDASRALPLSDSDANTDSEKNSSREKTPSKSSRARRCPKDFAPDLEFARTQIADLDAEVEAARFRDFEFKTPRSDWSATWRNWIRTCKDSGRYAKAEVRRWE